MAARRELRRRTTNSITFVSDESVPFIAMNRNDRTMKSNNDDNGKQYGLRNRGKPKVDESIQVDEKSDAKEEEEEQEEEVSEDGNVRSDEEENETANGGDDNNNHDGEHDATGCGGEDNVEKEPVVKARILTGSLGAGQDIYGFKTPKRREALVKAAQESVHSAKRSGKSTQKKSKKTPAKENSNTDYAEKEKSSEIKKPRKKIAMQIQAINLAGNQRGSSDEGSSENSDVSSDDEAALADKKKDGQVKEERDLLDEYFQVHHNQKKAMTSDATLSKLKNPKMERQELTAHLQDVENRHVKEITNLHNGLLDYFDKWMFQLLCGFNIMLYGLGSKRKLLEKFRSNHLKDVAHVVINGYFPSITLKQILNMITEDLLERDMSFKTVLDHCAYIKREYDDDGTGKLFLLIHNIDGQMLRSQNAQVALSQLASAKNIHMVASIDHINAPLIWDQTRANVFNWLWYDCTAFEPYDEETSYENSLLVQQSGTLALSSLTHVLRSLTPNAVGIFRLLAEHLLDNENDSSYQGLSFSDLYSRCRERFLVNSDLTLRAQLTEFKDHKLVKVKKGFDGVEYVSVAVDCATIKQFMEDENRNS